MKRCLWLLTAALLLCGCTRAETSSYWEQGSTQIQEFLGENHAEPDEGIRAVWIPVMHYAAWMTGKSADAFRTSVRSAFRNCAGIGINTVFLHVRAYEDAYYESDLFPKGAYLTGDYDPLAIMTEEAHAAGLAAHAWINPLRGQTVQGIAQTDRQFPLRQWYEADAMNGTRLVEVDGRYWLNPAYPEVRELVAQGVAEILERYDVEGIHIDDYFYPTQEPAFDAEAFAADSGTDLGAFRRANCNALVQEIYNTVKSHDPDCVFSISPQGNLHMDYDVQYADAALWAGTPGYCDWIMPQIYYGYRNEICPFDETFAAWEALAVSAELVVGLAAYKVGCEDTWAGSGADEWLTDETVLSRETAQVLKSGAGVAFYSYDTLFSPDASRAEPVNAERERIRECLTGEATS